MIKEFTYKKHLIRIIESDVEVESPREYEPLGVMCTMHRRQDFNEVSPAPKPEDFDGWDALKEYIVKSFDAEVILPVYMLDHSGIRLSTKPFDCSFDSGQIGFISTNKTRMLQKRTFKNLTQKLRDEAEAELVGEIETLDQWLRGEAYGFVIDPQDDNDEEGLYEEYGGAYWDVEAAELIATDTVDGMHAQDEEREFIETMPAEDLPKYINHDWKYKYASTKAYPIRSV